MTKGSSSPSSLLEVAEPLERVFPLDYSETKLGKGVKQIKVILDTNIYISAIIFGGNPKKILKLARAQKIKVFTSIQILLEISEKLHKKFKLSEKDVAKILRGISKITEVVHPKIKLNIVKEDPSDNKILECALEANADYIVTGDKHLLKLKRFEETKIVTPSDFLKALK